MVDGEVRGAVEVVTMEQSTLGASFAPFAVNPDIAPVPEKSRFRMAPLSSAEGCDALTARWDGGFEVKGAGGGRGARGSGSGRAEGIGSAMVPLGEFPRPGRPGL